MGTVTDPVSARSPMSAFGLLLDDLLSEIFLFCLPSDDFYAEHWASVRYAPFLLCRVCKWWKIVAYDTPRLWAFISTKLVEKGPFEAWIARSKSAPLHFNTERHEHKIRTSRIVGVINTYCTRWESICLYTCLSNSLVVWWSVMLGLRCDAGLSFPRLRKIHVRPDSSHKHDVLPTISQGMENLTAANLRILEVTLQDKPTHVLSFLQNFLQLEEIELVLRLLPDTQPTSQDTLVLPNVISFAVHCSTSCQVLFNGITLPNLKRLVFSTRKIGKSHIDTYGSDPDRSYLSKFLERSTPTLEELSLLGCTSDDLISCLTLSPLLKSLIVDEALLNLENILNLNSGANLIPYLSLLYFSVTNLDDSVDYPSLCELITSRAPGSKRKSTSNVAKEDLHLREVRIELRNKSWKLYMVHYLDRLSDCIENGLNVFVY